MPITPPASVSVTFGTRSGRIRLSLLDQDYANLVNFLNTVLNYSNYLVDEGAANAYVVNFDAGLTFTLTEGVMIQMKATNANSGASTLSVNGGAATPIKLQDGSALSADAIAVGSVSILIYTGTVWQLVGASAASDIAPQLPAALADSASAVPQTIWIPGAAMFPSISPLSPPNTFQVIRNQGGGTEATIPQLVNVGLAIGDSVQFTIAMPKGWNLGTITFRHYWTIATTGGVTGTKAKFQLAGVSMSDNVLITTNFGTAVGVEQTTVSPAGFKQYFSAESGPVTVGNTPTDGDLCYFKVQRVAAASDDITDDLTLLGIKIIYTGTLSDA